MRMKSEILIILVLAIFMKINGKECDSIDVRFRMQSLEKMRNCSVIKGFLRFALIEDTPNNKTFDMTYSFPELKEITGFMIVYNVRSLRTFSHLFPNLVVIRGAKLLLNFALGISQVQHLSDIGLNSLIAIQRGHVHINRCPALCLATTIDWDIITQTDGINIIRQPLGNKCPTRSSCRNCRNNQCWSSSHCQKYRDENLLIPEDSSQRGEDSKLKCHPFCLGGCINSTASGCNVCKGISNEGTCVEKCPNGRYLHAEHFRCYDADQCKRYKRFTHNNECVETCPAGFSTKNFEKNSVSNSECFPCSEKCPRVCEALEVQYLADAETLKGCTIINGTLGIRIANQINEKDLEKHLSNIEEIHGFLKIYRTISITSLSFLRGLKIIHGQFLEYNHYSLIIYDNQNLVDLWPKDSSLTLVQGGIFIHSNYKLCMMKIKDFQNRNSHNKSLDFVQKNEVEPSCNPTKLEADSEVTGFNSVKIRWKQQNISLDYGTEFIIFYRELTEKAPTDNQDRNTCFRDIWTTQVLLPKDLKQEDNHFVHNLSDLKQYTQYAFYIKTFLQKDDNFFSTQSDIQQFTTFADIPTSQIVSTFSKTSTSLTLTWVSAVNDRELINYYVIDMFKEVDNRDLLDTRDYCIDQLIITPPDPLIVPTDECCDETVNQYEKIWFEMKIEKEFQCTFDSCTQFQYSQSSRLSRNIKGNRTIFTGLEKSAADKAANYFQKIVIENANRTHKIEDLEPFKQYTFQFFACNKISGCGSYFVHTDRTAPDPDADNVTLTISDFDQTVNRLELKFDEPKNPNGLTVGYHINLKKADSRDDGLVRCLTRIEHERANFRVVLTLDPTNYKVRVRSISLAGFGYYTDWLDVERKIEEPTPKRISAFWYLLAIVGMGLFLYAIVKYKQRLERVEARARIRYEYSDRDELLREL